MSFAPSGSLATAAETLVVDASVAVKAALTDGFDALGGRRLLAPTLLWSEASSALAHLRWRGEISTDEAQAALARLVEAAIEPRESRLLVIRAAAIARRHGWARTYDAEYVALAELERVPLVTVDARLRRSVAGRIDVRGPEEL